jgi:hypothetical protein
LATWLLSALAVLGAVTQFAELMAETQDSSLLATAVVVVVLMTETR